MNFLSSERSNRTIVRGIFSIVVFLILALPVPSPVRSPVSFVAPALAWATSPDETLNPPPTPPKKSSRLIMRAAPVKGVVIGSRTFFGLAWRIYWATVRL
jgi:hypothetical protein